MSHGLEANRNRPRAVGRITDEMEKKTTGAYGPARRPVRGKKDAKKSPHVAGRTAEGGAEKVRD